MLLHNLNILAAATHRYTLSVSRDHEKRLDKREHYSCRPAQLHCVCISGLWTLWTKTVWLYLGSHIIALCLYLRARGFINGDSHIIALCLYLRARGFINGDSHIIALCLYLRARGFINVDFLLSIDVLYNNHKLCVWYCLVYRALPSVIYNI